jgi:hypothetical protein
MSEAQELSPVDNNTQQPVAVPEEVLAENQRLRAHNQQLAQENSGYRERARNADERAEAAEQKLKGLQRAGSSQPLTPDQQARLNSFDELQNRVSTLETELKSRDEQVRSERIKSEALNAFNKGGAINGMHLYEARKNDLVLREDGSVVGLDGGVERPLDQFVEGLKAPGSAWAYQFQASGARGSGAVGSQPTSTEGIPNPYLTGNFAAAVALEAGTPEEQALAARFKAEAGKK